MQHPHADSMEQYARDAKLTDKPHLLWIADIERLRGNPRWEINTTYTRHHNADWMIRQLNGEKIQYCEQPHHPFTRKWRDCSDDLLSPNWDLSCQFRIKPKTININGFEVPEPLREIPEVGTQFWTALVPAAVTYDGFVWTSGPDKKLLAAGMCHSTREAAEIHWNALKSFTEAK